MCGLSSKNADEIWHFAPTQSAMQSTMWRMSISLTHLLTDHKLVHKLTQFHTRLNGPSMNTCSKQTTNKGLNVDKLI